MLGSQATTGLLIEGLVRIADWGGYKNAGKGQLCCGNLLNFIWRELASTHPAEYPVFVVVRHRFLLCALISFSKHPGNPLSKKHGSKKTTEQTWPIQHGFKNSR